MDTIKELLRDPAFLTAVQRSEVLQLLWLMAKASEEARDAAEQRLAVLLEARVYRRKFMYSVRREIRILRQEQ